MNDAFYLALGAILAAIVFFFVNRKSAYDDKPEEHEDHSETRYKE